ncbi:MAG: hypothetical protein CBD00_02720 [Rhodospirillaceae bacterium TMED140]|nr:hypothetical protein [Rhodospirillaceae bacterium]OUX70548.1 MAG: hypothetical protein CBD00_02720 [Rhodospirillaceae bacterium TMED140]
MGILATFALGGAGGLLFFALNLPAPFMLGSVVCCWVVGGLIRPLSRLMDPVHRIRQGALALVGVVLGSYVTPLLVQQIPQWWPSLLLVSAVSMVMVWGTYGFLRLCKLDRATAWFSAQPAGLSEVIAIAKDYTDKDYVVALIHLIRVSTVFIASPLVVWLLVEDFDGQSLPGGQTHLWQTHWLTWVQYPVIAIAGVLAGRALRFPLAFLLGPMLLSALWAALGVLPFERPFEGVAVLQVILGSSIGARMAQVSFAKLWRYIPMAYGVALFMLLCAAAGAWLFSLLTGQPFARSFISVSAGGASELSLLAVALGYEVAFVTLHHLYRMFFVLTLMPLGNPPKRGRRNPDDPDSPGDGAP